MANLQVHQFPCLSDNYGLLIHDPATGDTASIDTPDADTISAALAEKGWTLTHILNTHHHGDHTGGNMALKEATGCRIIGPHGGGIPGIDQAVGEGDIVTFGSFTAKIIETPGHTLDHIIYWFEDEQTAFVGDTVFALGCGRVFEGTFEQMWSSLAKVRALPPETIIYCAHEYTLANANFAITVDPDNDALKARIKKIKALRNAGKPTVPTTLEAELATNPFLRPDDSGLQNAVGLVGAAPAEVFAEVRRRKDSF
jgi:hydroxyacylglutathione hydrolase